MKVGAVVKGGRRRACFIFGKEMRSWRGHISRDHLAQIAGVPMFAICLVEHSKAHQVRIGDLVKLVDALRELHKAEEERRVREAHRLLKIISPPRQECRRCHYRRLGGRKR